MLTKQDLIKAFADKCQVTNTTAELALDTLEFLWADALVRDEEIVIPGIGRLRPVTQRPRKARHPQTGEVFQVEAKPKVKFVIAARLKERLG